MFDASKYITKVSGKDYLEVKWRLVWFRDEHPNGSVATELLEHEQGKYAVMKATVSYWLDVDGKRQYVASASGHGTEERSDFGDYLEKAETKALGRALAALGYGTQFCDDLDFGSTGQRVVDSPVQRPAAHPATSSADPAPAQPARPNQGNGTFRAASEKQIKYIESLAGQRQLDFGSGELLIWASENVTHGTRQDGSTYPVTVPGRYEEWSSGVAAAVISTLLDTTEGDIDSWRNPMAAAAMPVFRPDLDPDEYGDIDFGAPDGP